MVNPEKQRVESKINEDEEKNEGEEEENKKEKFEQVPLEKDEYAKSLGFRDAFAYERALGLIDGLADIVTRSIADPNDNSKIREAYHAVKHVFALYDENGIDISKWAKDSKEEMEDGYSRNPNFYILYEAYKKLAQRHGETCRWW
jgi:hypothetical protein